MSGAAPAGHRRSAVRAEKGRCVLTATTLHYAVTPGADPDCLRELLQQGWGETVNWQETRSATGSDSSVVVFLRDGRHCGGTDWISFLRAWQRRPRTLFVDYDELLNSPSPAERLWDRLHRNGVAVPPPRPGTRPGPPPSERAEDPDSFWAQHWSAMLLYRSLLDQSQIRQLQCELEAKERVIQDLIPYRRTSLRYWLLDPLFNSLEPRVQGKVREWRNLLWSSFLLNQHAPRRLRTSGSPPFPVQAPRITLVTPSYHQEPYLQQTLDSVIQQNYPNLDYRVQDGNSQDGSQEILERYRPHLSYYESRPDSGQAQAINRAFAGSDGEIMGWLNSDDLLLPGSLATVATVFAENPEVDVIYGHRVLIDSDGAEIGRWVMPAHDAEVLRWADLIPQETLFWRRQLWERCGGCLNENYQFALDWDLLLRFQEAGARMLCLPRFLGAFRVHPLQKTSSELHSTGGEEMRLLRRRFLGRDVSDAEIYQACRSFFRRARVAHLQYRLGWRKIP